MRFKQDPDGSLERFGEDGSRVISGRVDTAPVETPRQAAAVRTMATLQGTIEAALRGDLPRGRELRANEPKTLNPMHISMCLDRATGMKPGEIAEKYDLHPSYASVILNHPDADVVIARVLGQMSDRVSDPILRIQGYAHEAISSKVELMRTSKSEIVRDRVATDLLDRAGYGARRKLEVTTPDFAKNNATNEPLLTRLAAALEEAKNVRDLPYERYVSFQKPSGEVDGAIKAIANMSPGSDVVDSAVVLPTAPSGDSDAGQDREVA